MRADARRGGQIVTKIDSVKPQMKSLMSNFD
jgi:hypothetical protein